MGDSKSTKDAESPLSPSSAPPPPNDKSPPTPPSPSSSSPPGSPPPSSSPPPPSSSPPPSSQSPPPNSNPPPQSSPPPSSNSPPQSSPPPSNPNPSPPSSQNNPSNPPPDNSNNGSPPSGNNNNNNNGNGNNNNNQNKQWQPPPASTSSNNSQDSNGSGSLSPSSDSSDGSPSSSNGSSMLSIPLVAVVAAGIALLIILLLLFFFACRRKRDRERNNEMPYYNTRPTATVYYNSAAAPTPQPRTKWQTDGGGGGDPFYNNTAQNQNHSNMHTNHDQLNDLPPIPGGRSKVPPRHRDAAPVTSSDMSHTSSSGPSGPVLPPPPPIVALGLSQSSFSYEELSAATGGFSQSNLLGQGGFGYVHKGTLPNGKEIAVKSLKSGSGQGDREFKAEVEIISRVHHRHLVSLVGFCIAGGKRMLVYEYVPNNNLEYHLHGKGHPILDWPSRLKIALGSAKGFAYLHEDCHPRIIHRDIKSSNILIDFTYEAKVADFGLAKLTSDNNTHVSTRVMGTFGYLAPEYASTGKLTEKSDVFSFGVVLLELITGRRPVDPNHAMEDSLVDWARPLCLRALEDRNFDELADPYLENKYPIEEMARMVACAGASIRHSARRRPKISQIIRALEGDVSLEDLNNGIKSSQDSIFGGGAASSSATGNASSRSSDLDNSSYTEDLKKLRKMAGGNTSGAYVSSEYGATSEYGLNPSSSSSSEFGSQGRSPHIIK